jgi:hypothetical protein
MAKKSRLSRDQKRKVKLKKREQRLGRHESLAYHGTKYQGMEYETVVHRTEIGIHESDVMLEGKLTDAVVERALESMIIRMRQKTLTSLSELSQSDSSKRDDQDVIVSNVLRNWKDVDEFQMLPGRDDLIGILRTLLRSIETRRSMKLHSRAYLDFLEDFLKETGVSVRRLDAEDELDEFEEEPEVGLLDMGRDWIHGRYRVTAEDFGDYVEDLLEDGDTEYVIDTCQQLIRETNDASIIARLQGFMSDASLTMSRGIG